MKYLVLVADGMADLPLDALRGRTPLEVAKTPAMDKVVQLGRTGLARTIPKRFRAGSDIGNLSLLGYDPSRCFTGRGPLEAARHGIRLGENEVVFRSNFVTISEERLADYSAGHITTREAGALIDILQERLGNDRVRFFPGVGYRHLVVVRGAASNSLLRTVCTKPYKVMGEPYRAHLPRGRESRFLRSLIRSTQELLAGHDVNRVRVDLGENPANSIWLWGGGKMPELASFSARYSISGAVISAMDVVNGIGALAGLVRIVVPGATGYYDTDYAAMGSAAVSALETSDFVYVHVGVPNEASHSGDLRQKIKAIEGFDRWVVKPALDYLDQHPRTRILAGTGHMASIAIRANRVHPVPFAWCGWNIESAGAGVFSETHAASRPLRFSKGHELIPAFIQEGSL